MIPTIQLLVGLLLVISIIAFIAVRLQVPASILLVLAGVGLALPAALPNVELSPEVVAMHHHMIGTDPQIIFMHYWGHGKAADLAAAFKSALDVLGKPMNGMGH